MAAFPADLSPHQLAGRLVDLIDTDELPDELADLINAALLRRNGRRLGKALGDFGKAWTAARSQISDAWREANASKPEAADTATHGEPGRVTPLRKEPS